MTRIFSVTFQSGQCLPLSLISQRIPECHLNIRVTEDFRDQVSVRSGFSQPGRRSVPEVVEVKVFNAGVFQNGVECFLDFTDWLTWFSRTLKTYLLLSPDFPFSMSNSSLTA